VIRWALVTVVLVLGGAAVAVGIARMLGRSGTAPSILVSVVAQWVGAWALWNFAGGLALHYGALRAYDTPFFLVLALVVGTWHYRTRLRAGPEQARLVFIGGQLAWLVIVLVRNGFFTS
jgi:hypothetical protein